MEKLLKKYWKTIATVLTVILLFVLIGFNTRTGLDQAGNEVTIIDRVAFTIFGRNIYWYSLSIITGISIAYLYGMAVAKKLGFDQNKLFDGFIWGVIIGVLGARIYYAIFSWKSGGFSEDPLKIFTGFLNEEGGLAIHGAVIAASIFAYLFCKKHKLNIFNLGEMLLPGFFIGQIFGRWGNFFNQEAHGGPISTSVANGRAFLEKLKLPDFIIDQMYIADGWYNAPIDSTMRNYMHPTFLYESLWNVIGLFIIIITRKFTKKYWVGDAVLFYLVWYGIGRYFIEALRTDALMVNIFGQEFRQAQVISVFMIIAGIVLFTLRRIFKFYPHSYIEMAEAVSNGRNI